MSPTSRKWETLFVFPFFLVVVVFVSVFVFLFLFLCFCFCFCVFFVFVFVFLLLCSLDAISSKFLYLFIECSEDDEAVEAMAEIDKFEDSLIQKEIVKSEWKLTF